MPAGYAATTGQIATATQHNSPLEDLRDDANAARPIVAGGTGATSASAARTALGVPATGDVQPINANLTSLAGLTLAANKGLRSTGANTLALFDLTAAGLALLDDADAEAQRTTLGLGGLATLDILDEDDFASDSATRPPSQQSVGVFIAALTYEDGPDATTSGTAFDFTNIPPGMTEIVVMQDSNSLSGTDRFLLQIGTGGTPTTSGYQAATTNFVASATATNGFLLGGGTGASTYSGVARLTRVPGTNTWLCIHDGGPDGATTQDQGRGSVTLAGELDMIRLTRTGTDTFDAGAWSIRCRK